VRRDTQYKNNMKQTYHFVKQATGGRVAYPATWDKYNTMRRWRI